MLIDDVQISGISKLHSLDTGQNPVFVYGSNYTSSVKAIEDIRIILENNYTLTRSMVNDARKEYRENTFFITNDGYFSDRHLAINEVLQGFKAFATQVQRLHASVDKSKVMTYNLRQSSIIIEDMLLFVKSLRHVNNG